MASPPPPPAPQNYGQAEVLRQQGVVPCEVHQDLAHNFEPGSGHPTVTPSPPANRYGAAISPAPAPTPPPFQPETGPGPKFTPYGTPVPPPPPPPP